MLLRVRATALIETRVAVSMRETASAAPARAEARS